MLLTRRLLLSLRLSVLIALLFLTMVVEEVRGQSLLRSSASRSLYIEEGVMSISDESLVSERKRKKKQEQLQNERNNNNNNHNKKHWDCTSIPFDLQVVLEPHCKIRPELPLSDLLPDLDFFRRIVKAVQSHNIALVAGRGTTATRTLTGWIKNMNGKGTIHHRNANCRGGPSPGMGGCYAKNIQEELPHISTAAKTITGNNHVASYKYEQLLDALAKYVEKPLSCGKCTEQLVFLDSPLVNLFTELYLALGPTTKVILTRRDGETWARKRAEEHGGSAFLCEGAWDRIPDPFSYTQCAHAGALANNLKKANPEIVRKSYDKYNAHVHNLVPGEYLLDIDLFSSATFNDPDGREKWSNMHHQLITEFLK